MSESNICRSPLAAALMQQCLEEQGLAGEVEVASRVSNLQVDPCHQLLTVGTSQSASKKLLEKMIQHGTRLEWRLNELILL